MRILSNVKAYVFLSVLKTEAPED